MSAFLSSSTLPFIALLAAVFLLGLSFIIRRRTGVPEGKIIYADPGFWGRAEKPLYDSALGLTGKPDYLVKKKGQLIPVEVKSMRDQPTNWSACANCALPALAL